MTATTVLPRPAAMTGAQERRLHEWAAKADVRAHGVLELDVLHVLVARGEGRWVAAPGAEDDHPLTLPAHWHLPDRFVRVRELLDQIVAAGGVVGTVQLPAVA
jgi:hypothetical protein